MSKQKMMKLSTMASISEAEAITDTSYSTLRRLVNDGDLPQFTKIGRSAYLEVKPIYEFISKEAGRHVEIGDSLKSSKSLEKLFNASSTFIWQKFQKNKVMKEKAVYLRSRPRWLLSDVYANKELSAYLEVVKSKEEVA
ncbi:MAG: Unknown protein [uncultured Thiotrichaceae bacterium]|uniref:Helix-turn-helix domain-containing protein n=1 Tax=uncultured Thiotrichaceae bacterium TaxID=298394 RepID=A0A6S6T101_9GAMM|nr:MAG: Unknown protein [uncultured Thiotrichaceae bacterium]